MTNGQNGSSHVPAQTGTPARSRFWRNLKRVGVVAGIAAAAIAGYESYLRVANGSTAQAIADVVGRNEALDSENVQLKARDRATQEELRSVIDDRNAAKLGLARAQEQLRNAETQVNALLNERADQGPKFADAQRRIDELKGELQALNGRLQVANNDRKIAIEELGRVREELDAAQSRVIALASTVSDLKKQMDEERAASLAAIERVQAGAQNALAQMQKSTDEVTLRYRAQAEAAELARVQQAERAERAEADLASANQRAFAAEGAIAEVTSPYLGASISQIRVSATERCYLTKAGVPVIGPIADGLGNIVAGSIEALTGEKHGDVVSVIVHADGRTERLSPAEAARAAGLVQLANSTFAPGGLNQLATNSTAARANALPAPKPNRSDTRRQ